MAIYSSSALRLSESKFSIPLTFRQPSEDVVILTIVGWIIWVTPAQEESPFHNMCGCYAERDHFILEKKSVVLPGK